MKIPGRLGSRFVDPRCGTRSGHPGVGRGGPSLRGLGPVPAKLRRLHCRLRPLRPTRAFKRVRWPKTKWAARSKRPSVWRRPPLSLQAPGSPKPEQRRWESPAPPPRKRRRQKQQQQPQQQQQEQTSFLQPQELKQQQGPPAPRPVTSPRPSLKVIQKRLAQRLAAAEGTQAARQYRRWTQEQIDKVQGDNPRRF
jgi:hypothetical protein